MLNSKMENEISINADFHTFKNQIVVKFGEQYFDQTEIFFEHDMPQAKKGLLYGAVADGKFALDSSYHSNDISGIDTC